MDDKQIAKEAIEWVKRHRKELFENTVQRSGYLKANYEDTPAASFMAGTPGAGKTEVSKRFANQFTVRPLRIDADEFREDIPGYSGTNSHVVQEAATLSVQKVLDQAFQCGYSFILDGTFAYKNAVMNLKRAHRKGYTLQVFFVYQEPAVAWRFTKIREEKEGRHVPKDVFIRSYIESRQNVMKAKAEFGEVLNLVLIKKNYETNIEQIDIVEDNLEKYLGKMYNEEELNELLQ